MNEFFWLRKLKSLASYDKIGPLIFTEHSMRGFIADHIYDIANYVNVAELNFMLTRNLISLLRDYRKYDELSGLEQIALNADLATYENMLYLMLAICVMQDSSNPDAVHINGITIAEAIEHFCLAASRFGFYYPWHSASCYNNRFVILSIELRRRAMRLSNLDVFENYELSENLGWQG